MAMTIVQQRSSGGGAGSAINLAFLSNTSSGNLIVVTGFYQLAGGTISSIGDGTNTYAQTTSSPFAHTNNGNHSFCAYAKNVTGGVAPTVSVNLSGSSTYNAITIYEISGASTTVPFVTDSTGSAATGTSMSTGTLSLGGKNCIICSDYESDYSGANSNTPTAFANYTQTQTDSLKYTWSAHTTTIPTATDQTAGATAGGSNIWGILAAAFTDGTGGSPTVGNEVLQPISQPTAHYQHSIIMWRGMVLA